MKNIGFIVQNAECGHSYVSKKFADALKDEYNVFMLATGGIKHDKKDFWKDYNTTTLNCSYQSLGSSIIEVLKWIKDNKLDAVFFNEMYDWQLVEKIKATGAKTISYLDWFTGGWIGLFENYYDLIIACAEHTYDVFFEHKNSRFIPWGVHLDSYKPSQNKQRATFFHSAGWGGINFRKGTPEAIKAYNKLWKEGTESTFYLHTQTPIYDTTTKDRIQRMRNNGLDVHLGTHPGLYHKGKVYVAPTKLEGLGLYIPEALASGLPVITTDAPPMNQFIRHGYNGWLVDVEGSAPRKDGYYFEEHYVNEEDLYQTMKDIANGEYDLEQMSTNAREFMEEHHDYKKHFKPRVLKYVNELWSGTGK